MTKRVIIITMVAALLFSGCKTTTKITKIEFPAATVLAQRILQIQHSQPNFSTANVSKMSMAINLNNRDLNVSATIKIRKDSALHISIQPFMGIEMFKLELSPDSIIIFDKMNRKYYAADYVYFSTRFGVQVDYYSLQSLISSQLFCIGKKNMLADSCTFANLNDGKCSIGYQSQNIFQSSQILSDNTIQQVILKGKNNNYQMQTNYADFAVVNAVNFPQKISMLITNPNSKVSCDFSLQKYEFNNALKFSPSSKAHYSRGD
ncbi:MAG: DUF4292 domain-containing protein, partial [Paludibacter sp.]